MKLTEATKKRRKIKTELEKYADNMSKYKHKCTCGHTVFLCDRHPKQLCHWCKKMNYLYKEDEFKERMKEQLKKVK